MNVDAAVQYARALMDAAQKAIDEGRSELTAADLDVFSGIDDDARAELEAAIKRAGG